MAEKRTINLDVNTNAEQVGNQFDNLNKSIDQTTKSNKDLHASFEEVYGEIQPLTTQMGEMEDRLYQMALAGEQATDEFQDLLKEVGKYRKVQIDTDLTVDAAAQTMNQKLGGALQGAVSGFGAVQGAMGLFGTESEEVEAALLKVQSAMALTEGIKGLREGAKSFKLLGASATKAFKGMKGAFLATGIGAFVVTLGVVVAYWDDISEAIGFGTDAVEDQENAMKNLQEETKRQLDLMNDIVNTNQNYINRQIDQIKNEEEIKNLQAQGGDNQERINQLQRANIQIELQNLRVRLESTKELLNQTQLLELQGQIYRKEQELQRTEVKKTRKVHRTHRRAVKKEMISELEFARTIEDLKLAQLEESTDNEITKLKVKYRRIIEDTKTNEKLKEEQKTAIIIEQEKIRDQEINKIRLKSTENLLKLETKSIEEIKPITELKLQEQKEYYDKVDEIAAKSGLKRKEVEEELKNASFSIAKDTLSLVSELNSLFASENEENAKKAFKIDKATKLASATIAGVQATIEAFKTASASPITIGFPAYPFVQAGLAGSFAAVNIAKIAKSKFQGGGGAGELDTGTGGAGGGGGASATPTAQFNVVGDSGINQLAELQNQKPTQAFVVSSEVTTAQSLDRNRVQNATL